jgi:steroid 5-alpha reductase family enzyme
MEILNALGVAIAIQITLFTPAYILKADKLADFAYGLAFILLTALFYVTNIFSVYKAILFFLILVWGLRLAVSLVIRSVKKGRDFRFYGAKDGLMKFIKFWLLQGFAVWIIMIPTMLFMKTNPSASWLMFIGVVVWAIGFGIETIADIQRHCFLSDPKNKGMWVDIGLWKHSRHPNYVGEILVWTGVYIYTLSSFGNTESMIAFLSPICIGFILICVSGIPPLEKYADRRWGRIRKYQEYKKKTSILIPWNPKR